ncbi:hypothetical protein C481_20561 [Natrialba asiatica DSM 12278]|uniref:Uncharacterized protein n=1 Tax=Natrialba asiatica (strain ATCC 700177 / DSM 12278 / JCM 9576 / FERM P-10747 / NBRC 102637 / 172P1) TaxID=29540 RepID=M0AII2_NATA1|nr:hypothetical protein C481_20561 [Natrialba asiatica DSM 12278]
MVKEIGIRLERVFDHQPAYPRLIVTSILVNLLYRAYFYWFIKSNSDAWTLMISCVEQFLKSECSSYFVVFLSAHWISIYYEGERYIGEYLTILRQFKPNN